MMPWEIALAVFTTNVELVQSNVGSASDRRISLEGNICVRCNVNRSVEQPVPQLCPDQRRESVVPKLILAVPVDEA